MNSARFALQSKSLLGLDSQSWLHQIPRRLHSGQMSGTKALLRPKLQYQSLSTTSLRGIRLLSPTCISTREHKQGPLLQRNSHLSQRNFTPSGPLQPGISHLRHDFHGKYSISEHLRLLSTGSQPNKSLSLKPGNSVLVDQQVRHISLSPKAIVDASPQEIQPYLHLCRFDKPIGRFFLIAQTSYSSTY